MLAGTGAAACIPHLGIGLLVALCALALASGSRPGRWLLWLAIAALWARLAWTDVERSRPRLDSLRPVEARVLVVEHPRRGAFGWTVRARMEVAHQGTSVDPAGRDVVFELPADVEPALGERYRGRGYLSRGEGFANRLAVDGGPWRFRIKARSLVVREEGAGWLASLSTRARRRIERALEVGGGGPGGAFARALVLGDASGLEAGWRRGMRRSGLAHLLAVSGFNVSLAAVVCLLAGWWLPGRWRYVPAGFGVLFYLFIVGPMAPILRATLMTVLLLAALSIRRPPHPANALALTVGALLLWRPQWIGDAGFQLTVAATAGLMFLTPRLEASWPRLAPGLRRTVAASVAAQLATLPIVIATFHHTTPLGVVANLFAVPWSALLMLCSLGWCAIALVAPQVAAASAPLLDAAAWPFVGLAATPAGLWLVQPTAASTGMACLLGAALLSVSLFPRRSWAWAALALLGLQCARPRLPGLPSLTMLDVGQGDAILLRGGGRAILVDGGGWSEGDFGGRVLLPALAGEGLRRLDAVVLTHSDRDHCAGLLDLVDYLHVGEIWAAPGAGEGCARQLLLRAGPRLRPLWRGERWRVGAWSFDVLGPPPGVVATSNNARSLVLLARAGGASVLLTGDIAASEERALLDLVTDSSVDVLKVAHHGSRSSTSEDLLSRLRPRLALVSVGPRNPFGHPHPTVLARLARRHVPTLRTDLAGEIAISVAAGRLRIETPAAPR